MAVVLIIDCPGDRGCWCGYMVICIGVYHLQTMDIIIGIRVTPPEEIKGLEIQEHGTPAYPNFYSNNN
jgi:ammonia channel protein AmtB